MAQTETKLLAISQAEAELIVDAFKVSAPLSRRLVLTVASMLIEWDAQDSVAAAAPRVTHASSTLLALRQLQDNAGGAA